MTHKCCLSFHESWAYFGVVVDYLCSYFPPKTVIILQIPLIIVNQLHVDIQTTWWYSDKLGASSSSQDSAPNYFPFIIKLTHGLAFHSFLPVISLHCPTYPVEGAIVLHTNTHTITLTQPQWWNSRTHSRSFQKYFFFPPSLSSLSHFMFFPRSLGLTHVNTRLLNDTLTGS